MRENGAGDWDASLTLGEGAREGGVGGRDYGGDSSTRLPREEPCVSLPCSLVGCEQPWALAPTDTGMAFTALQLRPRSFAPLLELHRKLSFHSHHRFFLRKVTLA